MKTTKLLFVTHKYPPSTGGMQKQSFELISQIEKDQDIDSIIFKSDYPKVFFFFSVTVRTWLKVVSNKNIQLVHANDGLMALFLTPLLVYKKRLKLCVTIHGLDVVFNSSFYQFWVKKYLSRFSFLVAVSEATRQECIQRGINEDKVYYIPNAVELPEKVEKDPGFKEWIKSNYGINFDDPFIISSVGRPVPRKGFGWFAKDVLPNIEGATYLVAGTEMESSWIILTAKKVLPKSLFEKICKMLGVPLDTLALSEIAKQPNSNLILLGKIPFKYLIQLYLHSDIFVMPNLSVKGDFEGFGLVALEAGSLGAVCLAANVDGIPSAIKDGENGFLLESNNPAVWIEEIKKLQNPDQLSKARQTIQSHFTSDQITWKQMADQYLELFNAKLGDHA